MQKCAYLCGSKFLGGLSVKDLKGFDIDIFGLKDKSYAFEFEGDDTFFALFENSLVKKGNFSTKLTLDKSATMIQLYFHITGEVELVCDRSLEPFDHPIDIEEKHILKFGETNEELTDEIEVIARNTTTINVAQYIYEYIGLAVPMKKIHPKLADQKYEETEDALLVYRSTTEDSSDDTDETGTDPRWEALRKLNDN